MTGHHPSETDLALLAGGDYSWLRRVLLNNHVSRCGDCRDALASLGEVRSALHELPLPAAALDDAEWNRLAVEMRANIRLGLAAGECVTPPPSEVPAEPRNWLPRFAFSLAGVVFLLGAGMFLHSLLPHAEPPAVRAAVLESTDKGVQVRTGSGSMTLLNHSGDSAPDQTVTSQGAIRARYVDGDTGTVTITSVYVE